MKLTNKQTQKLGMQDINLLLIIRQSINCLTVKLQKK